MKSLAPAPVWEMFDIVCSVPHPSGHEASLREKLIEIARKAGLQTQVDKAGNLRIDRMASPGMEERPRIIMQAHMDMVPQSDFDFDFANNPVQPAVDGDYVRAKGTTLGADNGIGIALAMAMLLDKDLPCGRLSMLATVEEETGLTGAKELAPEMLDGDILLNFDSEDEGIYIGCAGGARMDAKLPLQYEKTPGNTIGVKLSISGMKGGHSGCDIHAGRGNAILSMAEFIRRSTLCRVAAVTGGNADNAIPRECTAFAVIPAKSENELRRQVAEFEAEMRKNFDVAKNFAFTIEQTGIPPEVWTEKTQDKVCGTLLATPAGVLQESPELGVVATSNNVASVRTDGALHICMMARSMYDREREALTEKIAGLYRGNGGKFTVSNTYPGWSPVPDSPLVRTAQRLHMEMFGTEVPLKVIHAGLECGILSGKNPSLQIISFGPTILNPHSPAERLDIASVAKANRYAKAIIQAL